MVVADVRVLERTREILTVHVVPPRPAQCGLQCIYETFSVDERGSQEPRSQRFAHAAACRFVARELSRDFDEVRFVARDPTIESRLRDDARGGARMRQFTGQRHHRDALPQAIKRGGGAAERHRIKRDVHAINGAVVLGERESRLQFDAGGIEAGERIAHALLRPAFGNPEHQEAGPRQGLKHPPPQRQRAVAEIEGNARGADHQVRARARRAYRRRLRKWRITPRRNIEPQLQLRGPPIVLGRIGYRVADTPIDSGHARGRDVVEPGDLHGCGTALQRGKLIARAVTGQIDRDVDPIAKQSLDHLIRAGSEQRYMAHSRKPRLHLAQIGIEGVVERSLDLRRIVQRHQAIREARHRQMRIGREIRHAQNA